MEPQPRLGLAALTQVAFDGGDLTPLWTELASQCVNGTASAGSFMDMSVIEQLEGKQAQGLEWQSKALEMCRLFRTYRPHPAGKRLLVFAEPIQMGGNTPIEFLLPGDVFEIVTFYADVEALQKGGVSLPPHDIAFCAAPADTENADIYFKAVREMAEKMQLNVLNLPENLVKPERDTLPDLFGRIDGLRIPKTKRLSRQAIKAALEMGSEEDAFAGVNGYPFVVRPVGSHAGLGLAKIASREEFFDYLKRRDERQFFVGEFVNYASQTDGKFRKYRIVLVDGQAFPCHMAISDQWDVWYMNSRMRDSASKRSQEAAFMDEFAKGFGKRHQSAFEALSAGIGLDYFGIDCAEDSDGNLVVFEADNALIVHDMDCKETFPYKAQHMQNIFTAFEAMLLRNCTLDAPVEVPNIQQSHDPLVSERSVFA